MYFEEEFIYIQSFFAKVKGSRYIWNNAFSTFSWFVCSRPNVPVPVVIWVRPFWLPFLFVQSPFQNPKIGKIGFMNEIFNFGTSTYDLRTEIFLSKAPYTVSFSTDSGDARGGLEGATTPCRKLKPLHRKISGATSKANVEEHSR